MDRRRGLREAESLIESEFTCSRERSIRRHNQHVVDVSRARRRYRLTTTALVSVVVLAFMYLIKTLGES